MVSRASRIVVAMKRCERRILGGGDDSMTDRMSAAA